MLFRSVWCDVKESWDKTKHPLTSIAQIVSQANQHKPHNIVVTGGEPLMYDLNKLTDELKKRHFNTMIETSGAYAVSGNFDWICVSPKKFKPPIDETLLQANELKVVVFNASDFAWAERYAQKVSQTCQLFLQPEWDKQAQMLPLIIDYVKKNPHWKISIQTHKYMNIP